MSTTPYTCHILFLLPFKSQYPHILHFLGGGGGGFREGELAGNQRIGLQFLIPEELPLLKPTGLSELAAFLTHPPAPSLSRKPTGQGRSDSFQGIQQFSKPLLVSLWVFIPEDSGVVEGGSVAKNTNLLVIVK